MTVRVYDHVFPLIGGDVQKPGQLEPIEVYGTAFSIGGNMWMTAAHVLRAAAKRSMMGLGFMLNKADWRVRPLKRYDPKDSHDVGVFDLAPGDPMYPATASPWLSAELLLTEAVKSLGFPYALDYELGNLRPRGFQGYVVGGGPTHVLPARPHIYELSFQCPRGLSGAPLFVTGRQAEQYRFSLAGVMVGNSETKMLVHSATEAMKEGKAETIVERYETLALGIAVQARELLPLRFEVLGGSVEDHLRRQGLLGGPPAVPQHPGT